MPTPIPTLRAWRRYRGLSAEQVAERAGYHRSSVYKVEKGVKSYTQDFLEKVAAVLDCTPADLIGRQPPSRAAQRVIEVMNDDEAEMVNRLLDLLRRSSPEN